VKETILKRDDKIDHLIKAARVVQKEVKENQAGVGTFFQLTFIRFINTLESLLQKYGSFEEMESKLPREEFASINERLVALDAIVKRKDSGRFLDWDTRMSQHGNNGRDRSEIGFLETLSSQGQFNCLTWKGIPLFKSAYDYAVIPMLIYEQKPKTIIELGSGAGASAIWMSDMLTNFDLDTHIYSIDLEKPALEYKNVTYMSGDCFEIEKVLHADLLQSMPKPWLVIEDAHANVLNVMNYLDQSLIKDDYFLIEDSGPKREELDKFMNMHEGKYLVDSLYTDLFGKNSVSAYDSIFKRV